MIAGDQQECSQSKFCDPVLLIGANIEEAQAAESKADFTHRYNIALKEARETKYWLRLISASKRPKNIDIDSLIKESDEICRIIAQIIINARKAK
jgi:four helix bundle protein